jgi:septal ring factor EnvC (AmiA/AmiB activator)
MELTLKPWRPIVRGMESNLSLLDQKLSQLIALLDQSREQSAQLRARLDSSEARCTELETQMNAARTKLEQVVARLPESVNLS